MKEVRLTPATATPRWDEVVAGCRWHQVAVTVGATNALFLAMQAQPPSPDILIYFDTFVFLDWVLSS